MVDMKDALKMPESLSGVPLKLEGETKRINLQKISWSIDPIQNFLMSIKAQKMPVYAEALSRNMTGLFYNFLRYKVAHREVITLEAKGPVRSGKSTAGISICKYISMNTGVKFTVKMICPNEQYYNQLIPKAEANSCILVDEQLEQHTGTGAFREMQHTEDLGNIIAKLCIHSVWVHPNEFVGRNAQYGLETCGRNLELKLTKMLLYDLSQKTFGISSMPLGYVIVPKYDDPEFEREYERKKDVHIDELREEKVGVRQQRKLDMGFALARNPLYRKLKNQAQKLQLAQNVFPMLTIGEYSELIAIAKMNIDLGISQKDFDEAKKSVKASSDETESETAERLEELAQDKLEAEEPGPNTLSRLKADLEDDDEDDDE